MTRIPPTLSLLARPASWHRSTPQHLVGASPSPSAADSALAALIVGAAALAFVCGAALATVIAMIGAMPT